MSWYNTQGPCQNHVLFSKVRYSRNLAKQNFYPLVDQKRRDESISKIESILQKNGFRGEKALSGLSPAMLSLAEKQFVERDFVYTDKPRALYLNEPCNLLVALGGDNYITVTSVVSGLALNEARNMASGAEELIDRELSFAYTEGIGYLSPIIDECGSGVTFSACLYLPSIRFDKGRDEYPLPLTCRTMSLSPMFKSGGSDLYILSYTPHYLSDESSAAAYFSNTVSALAEYESKKLSACLSELHEKLSRDARRALGLLLYSPSLSEGEMLSLISAIRLSSCVCPTEDKSLPSVSTLNYLCAEGLNCSVIASSKEGCRTQKECDIARSKLISSYIQHKNEVT